MASLNPSILYINGIYVCGMSRDTVEEIISRGDTEYIIIRSQGT